MKTPEEIKKGLECIGGLNEPCVPGCPYEKCCECGLTAARDAIECIQKLETSYSQVSKALCGKENATLEELLQEVSQVKSRLAQVERERDAAVFDLGVEKSCYTCEYGDIYKSNGCYGDCNKCEKISCPCESCRYKWRGVCHENTKEGT